MDKVMLTISHGLKVFFAEKINVLCALVLLPLLFNAFLFIEIKNTQNLLLKRCEKLDDKIDYRYFNLTRSIQDIHGVNIDTKRGNVVSRFKIVG